MRRTTPVRVDYACQADFTELIDTCQADFTELIDTCQADFTQLIDTCQADVTQLIDTCQSELHSHTPSIAFRHLPPNCARFSYVTPYLHAAVHRRGQSPPKDLGTDKTVEAT